MNTREFIDLYGAAEAERVAQKAGSNLSYFKQLASRHRRPSVKLAQRLVEASDGKLDFVSLLTAKPVVSKTGKAA